MTTFRLQDLRSTARWEHTERKAKTLVPILQCKKGDLQGNTKGFHQHQMSKLTIMSKSTMEDQETRTAWATLFLAVKICNIIMEKQSQMKCKHKQECQYWTQIHSKISQILIHKFWISNKSCKWKTSLRTKLSINKVDLRWLPFPKPACTRAPKCRIIQYIPTIIWSKIQFKMISNNTN